MEYLDSEMDLLESTGRLDSLRITVDEGVDSSKSSDASASQKPVIDSARCANHEDLYRKHIRLLSDFRDLSTRLDERMTIGLKHVDKSIYVTYCYLPLDQYRHYKPLSAENYVETFSTLLEAEFAFEEINLRLHDHDEIFIEKITTADGQYNRFVKPDFYKIDLIPRMYYLFLKNVISGECFIGQIMTFDDESVTFNTINPDCSKSICYNDVVESGRYSIRLMNSTTLWHRQRDSVICFDNYQPRKLAIFSNFKLYHKPYERNDFRWVNFEASNRRAKLNERQRCAIMKIIQATFRPGPHILLGAPGTGKTLTLVELVVQLYHRHRYSRILVTGSSNTCVDKLANEIYSTGEVQSMCRLATLRKMTSQPDCLVMDASVVINYRVVITTNGMVCHRRFKRQFFDYVIIDEACHACEPDLLMPINRCKYKGTLVLAGDPNQLAPPVKFAELVRLGLGKSMVARLIYEVDQYKKIGGRFNERYVTELNESYRCDPRILEQIIKTVYLGNIVCRGRTPPSVLRMLKVNNPRLFISIGCGDHGEVDEQIQTQTSADPYATKNCIDMIMKLYMMGFESHQIGVLTMYKPVRNKIRVALESRLELESHTLNEMFPAANRTSLDWLCTVDVFDGFHGGEREVMLIVLVEIPYELGHFTEYQANYHNDEHRFNFSVSRAKWLNIVVGHENVVKTSPNWSQYSKLAEQFII